MICKSATLFKCIFYSCSVIINLNYVFRPLIYVMYISHECSEPDKKCMNICSLYKPLTNFFNFSLLRILLEKLVRNSASSVFSI